MLQGNALDHSGDWTAAQGLLKTALRLAPNEPAILNLLGYAQIMHRSDVPEALNMLRRANRMQPDDPAIADSLGWAIYMSGDALGAVAVLERAAAAAPQNGTIEEHFGDALWSAGLKFEARYAWRRAELVGEKDAKDRLTAKLEHGLLMANAAP
jgi:Flp pilus assembly protein TadD